MSNRFSVSLAFTATVLVSAIPVLLFLLSDVWAWQLPLWVLAVVAFYCTHYASYEVACRLGPAPIVTPLTQLKRRYPQRRDRVLALLTPAIVLGLTAAPHEVDPNAYWQSLPDYFFLSVSVAFLISVLFGTRALRHDVMPQFLKRFFV